jgi:hypothetical protein
MTGGYGDRAEALAAVGPGVGDVAGDVGLVRRINEAFNRGDFRTHVLACRHETTANTLHKRRSAGG